MSIEKQSGSARCSSCSLQRVCLPAKSSDAAIAEFERLVSQPEVIEPERAIFSQDEPLKSLYTIRSGAIKAVRGEGSEQHIVGFILPGELLGFHAIHTGRHPFQAIAIEPVYLCRIDFTALMQLLHQHPTLVQQFMMLMSRQLLHEQNTIHSLSQKSADTRLAGLLVSFSEHYRLRGFSPVEFWLPVSRQEMSNFLALAVETVSRIFSRFQQQGLLRVKGRHVEQLDLAALYQLAGLPYYGDEVRPTVAL